MKLWSSGISRSKTGELRVEDVLNLPTYDKVKYFVNKVLNKFRTEKHEYCRYIMFSKHNRTFIMWRIKNYKFTHEMNKSDNLLSELIYIQSQASLIQNDLDMEELAARVSYNRANYIFTKSELSLLSYL